MIGRRGFLKSVSLFSLAAASTRGFPAESHPDSKKRYRAAIIGHTGAGNYGHELDMLFTDDPRIELNAIADPDDVGRKKAMQRSKALREYSDYRTLLEREKPQPVCVAPRWTDEHSAMIRAAIAAGAHVFSEKPFTQTLKEADELLGLADHSK